MRRLVLLTTLFPAVLACMPAFAQKPVITRNADEPGRNPYQQHIFFNQTAASCPNDAYCVGNFDPVPAGYRLVVTYASARFNQQTAYPLARVSLCVDGDFFGALTIVPGTADSLTQKSIISAGALTFYVEAGHSPSVIFSGSGVRTNITSEASISGYLIALP